MVALNQEGDIGLADRPHARFLLSATGWAASTAGTRCSSMMFPGIVCSLCARSDLAQILLDVLIVRVRHFVMTSSSPHVRHGLLAAL